MSGLIVSPHTPFTHPRILDDLSYHRVADETLEELAEFFDELGDSGLCPEDYDCTLAVRELAIVVGTMCNVQM